MWGKSPHKTFYLTTHCGVLTQLVAQTENRAWGVSELELNAKYEDGFDLNLQSLGMYGQCLT